MRLYEWQKECLNAWTENGFRGVVNVATGAGKTVLALAAAETLGDAVGPGNLGVKIIVPRTFLVRQWYYALTDVLGVPRDDIGIIMGSHRGKADRGFTIYVINSARDLFSRHVLGDARDNILIIADECHHYGAGENARIFDFAGVFPPHRNCYALGLSATPYCRNYHEVIEPNIGPEIYRYTLAQALDADILSRFSVINVGLGFTADERAEYGEISDKLAKSMSRLRESCPRLFYRNNRRFFAEIDGVMKTHANPDVRQLARTVRFLAFRRKEVVHTAKSRADCVASLVKLIDERSKILIFGERIETAEEIHRRVKELFPGKTGLYHSKQHENVRKAALRDFENSEIRILVSCKTLDEGLNVSHADVGIIASSTSGERQRIQRLGRVLRKKEAGKQARFYYLYVKDTMEEAAIFGDLSGKPGENFLTADLDYDGESGEFTSDYYEEVKRTAIENALAKSWSGPEIAEALRNMKIGSVSCDWLTDERDCVAKIKESRDKRERNYFVTMLCLIRARLSLEAVQYITPNATASFHGNSKTAFRCHPERSEGSFTSM
ncbi:MAG: DEAD/DEAH box helicase [Firmicutes bacterium]|nr:DEAD/DEAH box helicase [Bacillota bacterium]